MKSINLRESEVLDLLATGRAVVRREVKPQPPCKCSYVINGAYSHALCYGSDPVTGKRLWVPPTVKSIDHRLACPYGKPGDLLVGRETWDIWACLKDMVTKQHDAHVAYKVTSTVQPVNIGSDLAKRIMDDIVSDGERKWRSSASMPPWASRLKLEVVSVAVEHGERWEWVVHVKRV